MRNYVIINGVNSLTIKGLAIKTLPPITKPIQRNLREEIDGRDGDIVTTLGYGAYDKTIEIGLFGTFDIDEVIAYFNQKGTITFSNEADKVYYFQALEQVDYAELLKFRTANVVLHCQPFKYPTEETPLEEEYEYVTGTGTNITLDNTEETEFNEIELQGNTSQNGTPTPDTPIPVNVVSGDNTIDICGKNLFSIDKFRTDNPNATITGSADQFYYVYKDVNGFIKCNFIANEYYKISGSWSTTNGNGRMRIAYTDGTYQTIFENYSGSSASGTINTTSYATKQIKNIELITWGNGNFTFNEFQIEKGSTKTTYEPYIGNTYPIYLGVENLWNTDKLKDGFIPASGTYPINNTSFPNAKYLLVYLYKGQSLTITNQTDTSQRGRIRYIDKDTNLVIDNVRATTNDYYTSNFEGADGFKNGTITARKDFILAFMTIDVADTRVNADVTYGTTPQYISTTPIELCKIGDYQDYIYKDNGSWYLHKEIGKVVLNGTETGWAYSSTNQNFNTRAYYLGMKSTSTSTGYIPKVCNYFEYFARNGNASGLADGIYENSTNEQISFLLFHCNSLNITTLQDWSSWLSTNKPIIYYVLETPTNTLITDTTLIEQLEALKNAESYEGQTNISQTNNDMPFVLDVSALKENSDHLVIDNVGNIYSKPTLDLEGTGIVDIYLNDTQMFEVDLSEKNEIVIDTEKMEAYNPTDNTLANRQVTGDYSKFKLESGENELRFSGDLTKATITKYIRWL